MYEVGSCISPLRLGSTQSPELVHWHPLPRQPQQLPPNQAQVSVSVVELSAEKVEEEEAVGQVMFWGVCEFGEIRERV